MALSMLSLVIGCGDTTESSSGETIRIGAVLPFSGRESAMGKNLEQAMLLAVEDVNKAGGVNGVPLELVTRDSNSGAERGLNDTLGLLYNENVRYVIGPEENELANKIVQDVKGLDILNILPGYAAPSAARVGEKGAWLRLAPNPFQVACGLAAFAVDSGEDSANVLSSPEDYNAKLVTDFDNQFRTRGGEMLPSVRVQPGQDTYEGAIERTFSVGADRTLLVAYPATAANIVTEWAATGRRGKWLLSPLLHTELFLLNTPDNSLNGSLGLSPSLSLASECEAREGYAHGFIECERDNAKRFSKHYAARWDNQRPFSAAHFYYDAVVLLALGMEYAQATQGAIPKAKKLQGVIRSLNQAANKAAYWYDLKSAMADVAAGKPRRYGGAAAEYEFDQFGAAQHRHFDSWSIRKNAFVEGQTYYSYCLDKR